MGSHHGPWNPIQSPIVSDLIPRLFEKDTNESNTNDKSWYVVFFSLMIFCIIKAIFTFYLLKNVYFSLQLQDGSSFTTLKTQISPMKPIEIFQKRQEDRIWETKHYDKKGKISHVTRTIVRKCNLKSLQKTNES